MRAGAPLGVGVGLPDAPGADQEEAAEDDQDQTEVHGLEARPSWRGRRRRAGRSRRRGEGPGQRLELALHDVVRVAAVRDVDVQADLGLRDEGLKMCRVIVVS